MLLNNGNLSKLSLRPWASHKAPKRHVQAASTSVSFPLWARKEDLSPTRTGLSMSSTVTVTALDWKPVVRLRWVACLAWNIPLIGHHCFLPTCKVPSSCFGGYYRFSPLCFRGWLWRSANASTRRTDSGNGSSNLAGNFSDSFTDILEFAPNATPTKIVIPF